MMNEKHECPKCGAAMPANAPEGLCLSPREALAIVPQICDALQYAHDQGIVHRDIKPENILLDRQGRVKVADFGLAKLVQGRDASTRRPGEAERTVGAAVPAHALTEAGKLMGTPQYMAPEQAERPGEVDNRADIYAPGVVFYQMHTGELPGQRLEPPSRKVQIDVRLDEVVLRALAKEPERRYQQASQVKTAVETIVQTAAPDAAKRETNRELRGTRFTAITWAGAGAVLALVAGWLCWYEFWRAPSAQPGRQATIKATTNARSEGRAPGNQAGIQSSNTSSTVVANGTAPLSYQWRFNETNQPGVVVQSNTPAFATRLTRIVKRDGAGSPGSPPTVEQILARYALARGEMAGPDKTRRLTIKGTFTSRDGLASMEAEALIKAPDKWYLALRNSNGPVWRRAFDGSAAWEISSWGPPQVDPANLLFGRVFTGIYRGDPLANLLPKMTFKGAEPIGGGQAYVLEVAFPGQPPRLWFDTKTGLLVRIECAARLAVLQMDWDDYRDIGGLMVPFQVREAGTENWVIHITEVKRNEPIEDAAFKRPPAR